MDSFYFQHFPLTVTPGDDEVAQDGAKLSSLFSNAYLVMIGAVTPFLQVKILFAWREIFNCLNGCLP